MAWLIWLYIIALLANAANLFLQVYFAVMYSDLEADYINPIDLCNKLNIFIVPEAAVHAGLSFLLLLSMEWFSFLLNVPLLVWNGRKFLNKNYLLDATEIFRTVHKYKTETFIKMGFHLLLFFYYLYSMIVAIIDDEGR